MAPCQQPGAFSLAIFGKLQIVLGPQMDVFIREDLQSC